MRYFGVLTVSHGSPNTEWVQLVDDAVAGVLLPAGIPVSCCFLEVVEDRLIVDGIRELETQGVTDILVLPLFISSGSSHVEEIAYALGVIPEPLHDQGIAPIAHKATIHFGSPINDDPAVAEILYDRCIDLRIDSPGNKAKPILVDSCREGRGSAGNPEALQVHTGHSRRDLPVCFASDALIIVGHGSSVPRLAKQYRDTLQNLARRIQQLAGFSEVRTVLLLPDKQELLRALDELNSEELGGETLVVPFFLSEGYFTKHVIPLRIDGRRCIYNGQALLPHPFLSRWIENQVTSMLNVFRNEWT